ncbi:MAG: AAA family ATPase [Planctomycetes bacterium]|nr:AAA family ATPase [Planctomycetota bacterium]
MNSVIGQSRAVKTLVDSFENNTRHHAWIFSGPRGVGKCTTAVLFAESVLGDDFDSTRSYSDLHIIRKEDVSWAQSPALQRRKQTNIPLDLLRERMIGGKSSDGKQHDSIAYKTPVAGKEKFFIIDEAELLDEAGQNALLKTLEEPPLGTTIILVTCREDLLLPTIQSRCQQLSFSPLSESDMKRWADESSLDTSSSDLLWALSFSHGSPGIVCEAIESGLPALSDSLRSFLTLNNSGDYTNATEKIILFIESNVSRWIKENPNTSKEAANRRALNLVLLLFGESSSQSIRKNQKQKEAISATGIIVDIEKQLATNISIKVLVESLCARWSNLCAGDALFV